MAVYELTRTALNDFFKKTIEKSIYSFDVKSEEITRVFMSNDERKNEGNSIVSASEKEWYNIGDPAEFHVEQYHIRLKDSAKDFIEKVFCEGALEIILTLMIKGDEGMQEIPLIVSLNVIIFLKDFLIKYIIKMDKEEYKVYLRILEELKKRADSRLFQGEKRTIIKQNEINTIFNQADIFLWFEDTESIQNTMDIINSLIDKKILLPNAKEEYQINY